jgi:transcription antitermination factor NusG
MKPGKGVTFFEADSDGIVMSKDYQFSEGDSVRVKKGSLASFRGRVVRVDNESGRLTVEGRFEGQQGSDPHTVNVSFSVVEKVGATENLS